MATPCTGDIHQIIAELAESGEAFALAVVLASQGSTPCKAGAKAIFRADGSLVGTIGGGAMEAEAARLAAEAIKTGRPTVFDFEFGGKEVADAEPICGGLMRVLVDPTASTHRQIYSAAADARRCRNRGVLITEIGTGTVPEVSVRYVGQTDLDRLPNADTLHSVLDREEPFFATEKDRKETLFEPLIPRPLLLIAGAGHVGQAVAWQADAVGFEVVVLDDRQEFLVPDRFPHGTSVRCGAMDLQLGSFPLAPDTYVVIVTRGHQHDADVLAACLGQPAAYVGMIGSRRKIAEIRKDFLNSGRVTREAFDRVYAPIGLDIGAKTVPEIATSIVAQLISVRRSGTALRI